MSHKDFMAAMLLVWNLLGMLMLGWSAAHVLGASSWSIRVGSARWFMWVAISVGAALITFGSIYVMTLL